MEAFEDVFLFRVFSFGIGRHTDEVDKLSAVIKVTLIPLLF